MDGAFNQVANQAATVAIMSDNLGVMIVVVAKAKWYPVADFRHSSTHLGSKQDFRVARGDSGGIRAAAKKNTSSLPCSPCHCRRRSSTDGAVGCSPINPFSWRFPLLFSGPNTFCHRHHVGALSSGAGLNQEEGSGRGRGVPPVAVSTSTGAAQS